MKFGYYESNICSHCMATNRLATWLRREHPEIEIEEIEL
jgi:hypothetical protein